MGDLFLRRKRVDLAVREILSDEERALHLLRFDLQENSVEDLLMQARSFPMLGHAQVFLIQGFSRLKKEDALHLGEYFGKPAEWSYLFFDADEIEESHPITKLALRFGERIDCVRSDRRSGIDVIHQKLRSEGHTITKEAWQFLEEKMGSDLMLLDGCVEKLILYAEKGRPVDLDVARKLADEFLRFDSFDLTEAISEKNPAKALQVFRYLYQLEGNAIVVVGLLNWQLKRLWQAKMLIDECGEREMFKALRISPYRAPIFLKQVSRFSFQMLEQAIDQLFQIDWKLKTSQASDRIALESFIIRLANPEKTYSQAA